MTHAVLVLAFLGHNHIRVVQVLTRELIDECNENILKVNSGMLWRKRGIVLSYQ